MTRRFVGLAVLLVSLAACAVNASPGTGEKVGQIVKLAKVGMMQQTWEAQIVRGGFQAGGGVNGQAFDFTVESDSLAHALQALMEKQSEVKIHYRSEGIYSLWRTESGGHFLVSIDTTSKK